MISRLSAAAAIFAVLATSTLAWAASSQLGSTAARHAEAAPAAPVIVTLPTVEVIGKRTAVQP